MAATARIAETVGRPGDDDSAKSNVVVVPLFAPLVVEPLDVEPESVDVELKLVDTVPTAEDVELEPVVVAAVVVVTAGVSST